MPLDADGPLPGEREEFLRAVRHRFRRAAPDLLGWSRAVRVEERGPLHFATFPFQPEPSYFSPVAIRAPTSGRPRLDASSLWSSLRGAFIHTIAPQ